MAGDTQLHTRDEIKEIGAKSEVMYLNNGVITINYIRAASQRVASSIFLLEFTKIFERN